MSEVDETVTAEQKQDYFEYLDDLRDSGITNMYGAAPYLQRAFDLSGKLARAVLTEWMHTFSERHPR
jgi:hypothetical protein